MSEPTDVNLTLDEKNSILDKILNYKNRNDLKNICSVIFNGISYYTANFIDSNGTKIEFLCSAYLNDNPRYGRFGLSMVDITITWNQYRTTFESASGPISGKITELIDHLKPICDESRIGGKNLLLG